MTETYDVMCWGDCLAGIVPNGGFAQVDPTLDITLGTIVSLVMKQSGAFSDFARTLEISDLLGVLKIFLGTLSAGGETIYVFGQLNPPVVAPVREADIEAMHLVTGIQRTQDSTETAPGNVLASMSLLSHFFQKCDPVSSVNPAWRPPEQEQST